MPIPFRDFLSKKIRYCIEHFNKNCVLLDMNGNKLKELNLSLEHLSDEYLAFCEEEEEREAENQLSADGSQPKISSNDQILPSTLQNNSLKFNESDLNIKINDKDLEGFWTALKPSYELALNLENQNISDESVLKLAELYQDGICRFTKLKLKGNDRITQTGMLKLGHALRQNEAVQLLDLHGLTVGTNGINRIVELIPVTRLKSLDLGLITNESLKYLAQNLDSLHHLESISFGENLASPWQQGGKDQLQKIIRRGDCSKQILSINIYLQEPIKHYAFIGELNLITKKNRKLKVSAREDEFKAASLDPSHEKYYDPDNHNINAYNFSVKSYLTNVFGSLLDEALYFLEKERRNQLRDEATFNITDEPINKAILEDICTSDGSIIVLTKYLLAKIKEKEQEAKNQQQNSQV